MKRYSCYVIDDMPHAIRILKEYIERTRWLYFMGGETDPLLALEKIKTKEVKPDIIFLDVEMPGMTGLELATQVADSTTARVIFSTAHRQYAVEAFAVGAIDYLLKPYDYTDFLKAIAKLDDLQGNDIYSLHPQKFVFLKMDAAVVKFYFRNIVYAEAERNYVRIQTKAGSSLIHGTFGSMSEKLPHDIFCQVHRSFIVNLNRVERIENNLILLDTGMEMPLGEKFKDNFFKRMREFTSNQFPG